MLKDLFRKPKYVTVRADNIKKDIPEGLWVKCTKCGEILYNKELEKNLKICHKCNFHFRLNARERLEMILDEGSFQEFDAQLTTTDPLQFPGYGERLISTQEQTGLTEAIVTGEGSINGLGTIIGVMDSRFIMGSMGSVVGEKITRAVEQAIIKKLPVIIFCASGGARMQEGIIALMQMAKTSAAIAKLGEQKLLYISVLTDPTTGGVTASFASLGDIILAEPEALIGFTGMRVMQQTIKQTLPEGFQKAEFLLEHGFVDQVVPRPQLKSTLANLIALHQGE